MNLPEMTRAWMTAGAVAGAALFSVLVFVQGYLWRRRRERAWPDRLDDLLEGFAPWMPMRVCGAILGVYLCVLAVSWAGDMLIGACSLATGASLCVLLNRRWHTGLAYLATALLTLSACTLVVGLWRVLNPPGPGSVDLDWAFALYGLAVMIFLWDWLALFWRQQLLDGGAWTTSGRMIGPAGTTALVLAVIALVVGGRLVFEYNGAATAEGAAAAVDARIIGAAIGLLALALVQRAMARRRLLHGTLSALAALEAGVLVFGRL